MGNQLKPFVGESRRDSSRECFFSRRNGVFEAVLAGISTTREVRRVRRRGEEEKGRGGKGRRKEGKKKKKKKRGGKLGVFQPLSHCTTTMY